MGKKKTTTKKKTSIKKKITKKKRVLDFSGHDKIIPNDSKLTKTEKLVYSAGYSRGMRDGIIGNYIVVGFGILISILIIIIWSLL